MPSSNASPEERLRRLEQEMAFIRSQGLSRDEHDRLLEDSTEGTKESGGLATALLWVNLLLTLGILIFLGWKEWSVRKEDPTVGETQGGLEDFDPPSDKPPTFLLPSRN